MSKGKKKSRKRHGKSCKCHDIKSCVAYVKRAYRARRRGKARRAPVSSMTYPTGVRTVEGW